MDDEWYIPPAWESEPSAVPGMSRGEFERLADQIGWFSRLTLEERLASFEHQQEEQRWFDSLRVIPREG